MENGDTAMEANSLTYRQTGDYLIPCLEMDGSDETKEAGRNPASGKYALMRRSYLENHRRALFETLLLQGQLWSHLSEIEVTAGRRLESIMSDMLEKDPPPDKRKDQMGWARHMNMTKALAEEMILDLIYE